MHCPYCCLCCREQGFFLSLAFLPEAFSGNQIFIKTPAFLTSISGPLGSQDVLEARYLIRKLSNLWPRVAVSDSVMLWRLREQSCCNRFPGVKWAFGSGHERRSTAAVWQRELRVSGDFRK